MVGLGPLHGLPGGAGVEGDEGGEVGRPERVLGHPIGELAGQVDPSQARHAVEIGKVCLNLDTTYCLSLKGCYCGFLGQGQHFQLSMKD